LEIYIEIRYFDFIPMLESNFACYAVLRKFLYPLCRCEVHSTEAISIL